MERDSAASHFTLDPTVSFLNHGSFGACPQVVLDAQSEFRRRMEHEPVRFFVDDLEGLLDASRAAVSAFVGCDFEDLVFIHNATTAVAAILSSLPFAPGDEILFTDHGYNACNNSIAYTAERTGARAVACVLPFPIASADAACEAILSAVTSRTRIALIDHITSPTGLVLPVERIVKELAARGIDTLVDGAHGPGMLPLNLNKLGAAYYTGNLHKWCCLPKGAAFLFVRRDKQSAIHPAVTSHGRNTPRKDRSKFLIEFDWTGTDDFTALLTAPMALRFMESLRPGGFTALMVENRNKALAGRRVLADALALKLPCPDDMIGSLASLRLPPSGHPPAATPTYADPLQGALYKRHRIQVPVIPWPAPPSRLIRISAQIYNHPKEYENLATALRSELELERA